VALTLLGSAAEVLVATGHDPFARGSLRRPLLHAWLDGDAVAWIGTDAEERLPYLSALGPPRQVAALLAELLAELPPRQRVTLPRGTAAHLPAWVGLEGPVDWDFRWLPAPPPAQKGEELVVPDVDDVAVQALLDAASPRASALPGDAAVRCWWGIPDGDAALLACAADTSATTGVGHLSSIATAPAARGRGLGKAVTGRLSRALFEQGCDVVTLGMYADNALGRRLYDSLGFRDEHRFTSGRLVQRTRW
jgi:GNAT superfamily N-acetyltransferase